MSVFGEAFHSTIGAAEGSLVAMDGGFFAAWANTRRSMFPPATR